ncbi:MAG: polysaccharide biosynthesis/export family protein [Acidobacteriota bacterium]
MKKVISYMIFSCLLALSVWTMPAAQNICRLSYEVQSDGKEMTVTISLPETGTDYRIDTDAGLVSLQLENFQGIIVSEKDRVEGFVEKVYLKEGNTQEKKGKETILKLSGAFLSGMEKKGNALRLRFVKIASDAGNRQLTIEERYVIGPDDKLSISIYNNPDLSRTVQVGKDGKTNFALIGDVDVAGLTILQLTDKITQLYARDYIVDPQVNIEVVEYNSQWAYITGEVRNQRRVALKGNTSLKDAIAEVGGLTGLAGTEIIITRKTGSGMESEQIRIDRTDFEEGIANIMLMNGDVITVPKMKYAYIQGEVKRNCDFPLEKGMTLLKAISIAQGLTDWYDETVEIFRESENGQIKEKYNLKKIMDGKSPDVPLKAGDIIIVKRRFL